MKEVKFALKVFAVFLFPPAVCNELLREKKTYRKTKQCDILNKVIKKTSNNKLRTKKKYTQLRSVYVTLSD